MIKTLRFAVPVAAALFAVGVNAQTVETDYPLVNANGEVVAASQPVANASAPAALYVVQSNAEGAKVAPEFDRASALTREDVSANATVRILQAPDTRS